MSHKALLIPLNSKQEVFLQDRAGHKPPPWGFFGGSIEFGETPLEAVIRETKEELDISLSGRELLYLGNFPTVFDDKTVEPNMFLWRTNIKEFKVLEGAGGAWLDYKKAMEHLSSPDRFEQIWQVIKDKI